MLAPLPVEILEMYHVRQLEVKLQLCQGREIAEMYQVNGTPKAALISQHGTIGNPVALGADAIRSLRARVAGVAGVVGVEGQSILKFLVMGAPTFFTKNLIRNRCVL